MYPVPPITEQADFSVAVVDADQRFRTSLAVQLGERARAASFASIEALEDRLPPGTPLVVVFGPTFADARGLDEISRLTRARPEIGAILVSPQLSTDLLQQALRAGVRDVLAAPVDPIQLATAVERVLQTLPSVYGPRGEQPASTEPAEGQGRVLIVSSTKGGTGKTVIATNLAVALARKSDRPVVLVDADLQFGDVAVMLKLAPEHTIVDAVNAVDRLDPALLQSLFTKHDPSGLQVLAAPLEPAFADQISAAQMVEIVSMLRQQAGFVVIDTPARLDDIVLGLIEVSDDILYVTGMDIPSIKNSKIGLGILRLLSIPLSKLTTILNRANSKVRLEVGEVERTLGVRIDCLIPSDVAVPQSVNKGVPVVLDSPRSGVARAIDQLADQFVTADAKRRKA
ncbi:MAG: P-loop NTPase [Acidimicrobiales bacterium]|nr:P-loop NTPase [Acidimicrobiales bacterium]